MKGHERYGIGELKKLRDEEPVRFISQIRLLWPDIKVALGRGHTLVGALGQEVTQNTNPISHPFSGMSPQPDFLLSRWRLPAAFLIEGVAVPSSKPRDWRLALGCKWE